MKFLSLLIATILLTTAPCWADAQGSLFRHAFFCPERGPSSVCIFGTIPRGRQVTLLAREWKSSAVPKEEFPNTDFDNGFKTITRLQVAAPPPKDASMIAVLASADAANPIPLKEVQDEALVARIGLYIKRAQELNLDPDIRLLKTRLLRLSPTILLSETFLAPPGEAAALEKNYRPAAGIAKTSRCWLEKIWRICLRKFALAASTPWSRPAAVSSLRSRCPAEHMS